MDGTQIFCAQDEQVADKVNGLWSELQPLEFWQLRLQLHALKLPRGYRVEGPWLHQNHVEINLIGPNGPVPLLHFPVPARWKKKLEQEDGW